MFDIDPEKILMLGVLAVVVLGPNRLPEAARSLGRMVAHWRKVSANLQSEMRDAIGEPGTEIVNTVASLRGTNVASQVRRTVTSNLTAAVTAPPAKLNHTPAPPTASAIGHSDGPVPDEPSLN